MNDFKVLLQAVLDSSGIGKSDIAEVQKVLEKYHVNLTADLNKAEIIKTIKQIVPELEAELKKITGIDIKINEADLLKAINQVEKDSVKAAKAATNAVKEAEKAAQQAAKEEEKLAESMERVRAKSELAAKAEEKRQQLAQDKAANKALEEEYALKERLAQQSKEFQFSIGENGNTTTQILSIANSFSKLGLSGDEVKQKMSAVNAELLQLKTVMANGDNAAIVNQFNKLQTVVGETKNDLKMLRSEQNLLASEARRLSSANTMTSWLENNSKASKLFGSDIKQMVDTLRNTANLTVPELNKIEVAFKKIQISARDMGLLGRTIGDSFKDMGTKFLSWISASGLIMTGVSSLRKMKDSVIEIDTAMTNLYKASDETSSKYRQLIQSSNVEAQKLGRTVSSLIEQTATWKKLGFTLDESSDLAKVSSIYANVGEVDDKTAVSDLVTAMKAFNKSATESITIVDSLNKLGNEFATDAASLGEGLKNSASSLRLAGNDINQTLAMLTGGTEIIQNAGEMGNALKILSMRIRGMKGELEALGEEYDNVESISKIQTQILNRTGGTVNIFDNNGNFRSTYEILKGISEVWDKISQTDQADLLEVIAGKQRGNSVAALIQSFQSGQVQKALDASINSAGSAREEQEKWLDSIGAKTQQYEASFQSLSQTIINSNFLKLLIDSGTTFNNVLDKTINGFGILSTTLSGAGIAAFIKNYG